MIQGDKGSGLMMEILVIKIRCRECRKQSRIDFVFNYNTDACVALGVAGQQPFLLRLLRLWPLKRNWRNHLPAILHDLPTSALLHLCTIQKLEYHPSPTRHPLPSLCSHRTISLSHLLHRPRNHPQTTLPQIEPSQV